MAIIDFLSVDVFPFFTQWVIPFLFVLSVLVFVHELGHYFIARWCGVRVEVFSIGFGPELFGICDRAGTRWKFSVVPLGGYVKMFGEHDFEDDDDELEMSEDEKAVSFHHKSLRARTAIVSGGPAANFLFAIILWAGLFALVGMPKPLAGVGTVQENSAAAEAGLQQGDTIRSINGVDVTWFEDVRTIVRVNPGVPLNLEVARGDSTLVIDATPTGTVAPDDASGRTMIGLLGFTPDVNQLGYERVGPLTAVWAGIERTYSLTAQILSAIGQIITGQRTADELGGPLRIAQLSGEMAQGGAINLILFMAMLSINLGLINLFPIPMLDGGHLAFYAAEAVRGKPLDKRLQEYGFRFGLALVLLLMIFATWNDITSLNIFDFSK
ncbi:MAG: RIP metalloprotease RseP [Hyphomicrobiales bacterium]|nr:RIP metalloprotease RseP [Hyphomicrobiales bacterium]